MKRLRNTIRLLVAFVALGAQAGVIGSGVLDARNGANAASHFESSGTNLHFAHNEADCFMCRAQHLGDAAPISASATTAVGSVTGGLVYTVREFFSSARVDLKQSRAPPAIV